MTASIDLQGTVVREANAEHPWPDIRDVWRKDAFRCLLRNHGGAVPRSVMHFSHVGTHFGELLLHPGGQFGELAVNLPFKTSQLLHFDAHQPEMLLAAFAP
jgi:hypothetical protein